MQRKTVLFAGLGALTLAMVGASAYAQMMGGKGGMGMGRGMGMRGMTPATMARHRDFMHGGVAAEYRQARNPLSASAKTLASGRTVYEEHCALCHGASGRGDGEGGQELNPKPTDLTWMGYRQPNMSGLMFYAVSEGGEPYGSAMPAYKDALSETERWAVITYIQAGLGG